MGDRRMISRKVVESARFLKMPATSQNLYFHLIVNADDDGIVEAYPVLGLTKANEDDLRILVSKQFVGLLNEDLVAYIEDWREQNLIRCDRKRDSRYKALLLQIRPDVELVESKQRSDAKKKKQIIGQSTDSPRTAQYNLSESKLSQENLIQENSINLSITPKNFITDRENEIQKYKDLIAHNIGLIDLYEIASKNSPDETDMVREIYDVICDIVCFPRDIIRIKKVEYPWTTVKSQFLKLRYVHVSNILNRIVDASLNIGSMEAYLISTLYTESLSGRIKEQSDLHDDYLRDLRGNPYSL